jgi:hypothetical protein
MEAPTMKKILDGNGGFLWNLSQETIGWIGIVTVVAMAFGVCELMKMQRDQSRQDEKLLALKKLTEISQLNFLVRRISMGKSDEAMDIMSDRLITDLAEFQSSLPRTDEATRSLGTLICNRILRTEKDHPEYYLSAPLLAHSVQANVWAAVEQSAFEGGIAASLRVGETLTQ